MGGKVGGAGAGYEVAVGIVAVGQLYDVGRKAGIFQAQGELMGSLLAGLV
jgi:hypothetical protein